MYADYRATKSTNVDIKCAKTGIIVKRINTTDVQRRHLAEISM